MEDRAVGSPESSEAGDEEAEGGAAGEKGSALAKTFTDWRYIALMVATLGAFISTIVMAAKQSPDAGVVAATGKAVLAAGIISLVILIPIFAACDFPWANRTVYNLMRGLGRCFKGFFISILAGVLSGSGAFGAAAGGYSMSQDRGDDDFYDADDCEPKVSALTALLVTSTLGSILASLLFWVIALGASPSLAAQGVGARPRSAQTQAAKPVEAFRDPVHGFFEVSLPSDCKMAKKGTDTTMKLTGPSPEAGKVVRCSRVSFGLGKGTIAVRARETFHGVVDDALMDEIMRRLESRVPSASVKDKRFMTCDEAKAAQLVATFQQFTNHTVRYKKHGLDHTINFTCPTSDYGLLRDPFLAFVGSYRSRDPRAEDAKGTPVAGEGEVETPGVAPDAPEPDVALELDLPAHHVLSRLPAGFGLRRSLSLPTSGGASSVCVSPNGRLLAAASGGDGPGAVRAWEASTGKEVYSIATDASSVHFSPDGRWLASSRADHVDVWDATTGKTVWSIDWPGEDVTCARFSPNGRWIAAAGTSVALWDVTTREKLRSFPNESVAAACLEFSPAGDMLAFPSGKLIRVFDAASGDERRTLKSQYTERVLSIAFSPDGKRLASTSHTAWNAMEIKLWDVTTGSEVSLSSGRRKESASSAAFSPDGRLLAVGGGRAEGRLLWVFDTVTSKILMKQAGTGGYTTAVCFNPAGSLIASSAREAETLLWAIEKTVRVPVRPTIPILQGKSRSRRIVTSSSTPCFSRVYWQVAGSDDQPSGDYFDGLANADSYCAALLARELLREYAYGMKAHSPYLQGAAAISEELGYRYGGLLKAVAQVRDKGRAALTEHRGLTFLAALSLLTTGDSDKVSAVTRVAPEYACLFVVECVARQWARPKRVLPSGVPPPLEKLEDPDFDLLKADRRTAQVFKKQHGYAWLMVAAEMGRTSPTTADRDCLRQGVVAMARATASKSEFGSYDARYLQNAVTAAYRRGHYASLCAGAEAESQASDLLDGMDAKALAKADLTAGARLSVAGRSSSSAERIVTKFLDRFEREVAAGPEPTAPADTTAVKAETKETTPETEPAATTPGQVPAGYKVYHLKDGRTVTAKPVGSGGGKIMVKDLAGKSLIINEDELAKPDGTDK